jgi:hypothetical protein
MHCPHLEYSQPALSFTLAAIGPVKAAKSGVSPECVSATHLPASAPLLVCVGIEEPPQSPLKLAIMYTTISGPCRSSGPSRRVSRTPEASERLRYSDHHRIHLGCSCGRLVDCPQLQQHSHTDSISCLAKSAPHRCPPPSASHNNPALATASAFKWDTRCKHHSKGFALSFAFIITSAS